MMFLSVVGPGFITSNVDNDAGGITTYSVAGATFGYSLLWTLIPITIALIVVQEMSARMGVVTKKGLADLIRENFGLRITFFLMIALFVTNLGNTIAEFAGIATAGEIFGISRYILVPISALFVWIMVVKGSYSKVEKIFIAISFFYISYIVSGLLSGPNWGEAARQTVMPTISFNSSYLIMLLGLVGTTIAPWMQFYLQASIVEKKVKLKNYKYSRLDVILGSIMVNVVALFIIIACAATLFASGIKIETAADAAIALKPLAGDLASALFGFGLFTASLFAASILPLATAYYLCEGFGWEKGINKKFREAPEFYWLYTGLIVIGALVILIPGIPLLSILLISQVINAIILPFLLIFILVLINDKSIMGKYTNSKTFNIIAGGTIVILIIMTVLLFVLSIFH